MVGGQRQRVVWVDALRGVAVLLVVLHHSAIAVDEGTGLGPIELVISSFSHVRMPMLMLLSGCLVPLSLSKGVRKYVAGKLRHVVWPYVGWQAQFIVMNGSVWGLLALSHWGPISTLWFLFYIGVYYTVAVLARPLVPWWVLVVLSAGLWLLLGAGVEVGRLGYYGIPFFLGAAIGFRLYAIRAGRRTLIAAAGVFVVTAVLAAAGYAEDGSWSRLVLSVFGVSSLVALASAWPAGRSLALFEWVGKRSIAFYVLHFPAFVYLDRFFDAMLDLPSLVEWALVLMLGVAACFAGARYRFTWPVSLLFEFPSREQRAKLRAIVADRVGV